MLTRRGLLVAVGALAAAGCTSITPRAHVPSPPTPAEFAPWRREAREILSDALDTLRAFEDYAAFRVSTADESARRGTTDLSWDPPRIAIWSEALHVAEGLGGRADQLFQRAVNTQVDRAAWREQRDIADMAHELVVLGESLKAYRGVIEQLPALTDGTETWAQLDRLWAQWAANAANWNATRTELIGCSTP